MVGRFATAEQFWSYYCHLVRPCELTGHSDFHLFKDGIKPMWEVIDMTYVPHTEVQNVFLRMMQIVVVASGL